MGSWTLTQAAFDRLLDWLDATDRHTAGERYEEIRAKLIQIFEWRRCPAPEDHADEVINRVARKIEEGVDVHVQPSNFFFGVAQFVLKEIWKRPREVEAELERMPAAAEDPLIERRAGCLDECMGALPQAMRVVVERFYQGQGQAKIDSRKTLAADLGIEPNALRIRVHRTRLRLEDCVRNCLDKK